MLPKDFILGYIETHEGSLSLDKDDAGNWVNGVLIGSKYGVTGPVLAKHRNVPKITAADMASLTLDEAVQIGYDMFYMGPHLDVLDWNQCTASVLDMGWGAGPVMAIKLLQRLIAVADDGQCGMMTERAYREYLTSHGVDRTAQDYADARNAYYDRIIMARPVNAKYRQGWYNRSNSFRPGTPWWKAWGAA